MLLGTTGTAGSDAVSVGADSGGRGASGGDGAAGGRWRGACVQPERRANRVIARATAPERQLSALWNPTRAGFELSSIESAQPPSSRPSRAAESVDQPSRVESESISRPGLSQI